MRKFEYKAVTRLVGVEKQSKQLGWDWLVGVEKQLNQLGLEGWELVAVERDTYYFKREYKE